MHVDIDLRKRARGSVFYVVRESRISVYAAGIDLDCAVRPDTDSAPSAGSDGGRGTGDGRVNVDVSNAFGAEHVTLFVAPQVNLR
jgi:hypothetical protein